MESLSVLWKYVVACEDDESKNALSYTFTTCVRFLFPVKSYSYSYSYSAECCSELFGIRPNTENPYSVQP